MPYDEALAARIRALLASERSVTEKRMFGGLGFLLDGHMAVAASGQGDMLVRVDPAQGAELLETTPAAPMMMRGTPARGWLRVDADVVATKRQLEPWVRRSVAYVRSLPPKR